MCQHPARQPTGGEFLIGNLAKKFLGSLHSYVKKTIITFLLHLCFYFLPHFPFFYFTIALTSGQPVQMGILWEVFIGQGKTIGCITSKRLDAVSQRACQINMQTAIMRMFGVCLMVKDLASASERATIWLEYSEGNVTSCTVLKSLNVVE